MSFTSNNIVKAAIFAAGVFSVQAYDGCVCQQQAFLNDDLAKEHKIITAGGKVQNGWQNFLVNAGVVNNDQVQAAKNTAFEHAEFVKKAYVAGTTGTAEFGGVQNAGKAIKDLAIDDARYAWFNFAGFGHLYYQQQNFSLDVASITSSFNNIIGAGASQLPTVRQADMSLFTPDSASYLPKLSAEAAARAAAEADMQAAAGDTLIKSSSPAFSDTFDFEGSTMQVHCDFDAEKTYLDAYQAYLDEHLN